MQLIPARVCTVTDDEFVIFKSVAAPYRHQSPRPIPKRLSAVKFQRQAHSEEFPLVRARITRRRHTRSDLPHRGR